MKSNIIDAIWFSPMGSFKTIGIVIVKNSVGTNRAFVGLGDGDSEAYDAQHVADTGAELHIPTLKKLIERLES